MKKCVLKQVGKDAEIGKFNSKIDAVDAMEETIDENNDGLDADDEDYLTPFDFTCEEVVVEEINERVTNYDEARKYLGGKPNADFTISKKILSGNCVKLEEVSKLVDELNPTHSKALLALNRLFTIAQAWNKADNFVPDYSNSNQDKWFPWFVYKKEAAGFVCAATAYAATNAYAFIGSRLCFKTPARARQFGEQFIDLWNDVLLFR